MLVELIGKCLFKIRNLAIALINRYTLSVLGGHGFNCHIEGYSIGLGENVFLGDNVFIGPNATFLCSDARIIIGSNVMFGPNVSIATGNHRIDVVGEYMINVKSKRPCDDEDVVIEDDVWIGMNTIILKGCKIGRGSVIGANSIVTKDVAPYTIYYNPMLSEKRPRFSPDDLKKHISTLKN